MGRSCNINRAKLNFITDAVMFFCLMALAGTGFLRHFRLSGQGFGRGRGAGEGGQAAFWGIDRHSWGDIHLWLGYIMLGLLALHITLHWREITGIYRRLIASPAVRLAAAATFLILSLYALLFPFLP